MLTLVIGIGIVINELGQILIDQRSHNQIMGGLWEFPGGKQENQETIENTISREIFEELGIDVKVEDKLIEFEHTYEDKKLHFVVHACKLISGQPQPLESLKIKWVKPSNLSNYSFPPANSRMIDALNDYLLLN